MRGRSENAGSVHVTGGFSLVEMLVAMVIMGFALSILYQSAMAATRNVAVSSEYAKATALAESLMDEFSREPEFGAQSMGQFEYFNWIVDIERYKEFAEAEPESEARERETPFALLTVEVSWEGPAAVRQIRLQTLLLVSGGLADER